MDNAQSCYVSPLVHYLVMDFDGIDQLGGSECSSFRSYGAIFILSYILSFSC